MAPSAAEATIRRATRPGRQSTTPVQLLVVDGATRLKAPMPQWPEASTTRRPEIVPAWAVATPIQVVAHGQSSVEVQGTRRVTAFPPSRVALEIRRQVAPRRWAA